MEKGKVKVLVVDDSQVVRNFIEHILGSDPEIRVIATASNGVEAVSAVRAEKPDVITMDMNMPKMNGFEATRKIMENNPTPIVIVSGSYEPDEVASMFRAIESGAVTVVPRPLGIGHPDFEKSAREFIRLVKCMAEVKVVRRWPGKERGKRPSSASTGSKLKVNPSADSIRLVAVGGSTGGPAVLQAILSGIKNFPVPIVIVQHIAAGFVEGFARWLEQSSGFPVEIAEHGMQMAPSHAYIAPDGHHLTVRRNLKIALSKEDPDNGLRPSIAHLFRSVAEEFGSRAVAVLLTGMGRDGAAEMKLVKDQGGVTIAQDEETSVIFGMPAEAVKLGAVSYVLPAGQIARALELLVGKDG